MTSKVCTKCNRELPLDMFYKRKDSKDGHRHQCKDCRKVVSINHYNKNKEYKQQYSRDFYYNNLFKIKNYRMQKFFGITFHEYNEMFWLQDGLCAICGKRNKIISNGKLKALHTDHNHKNGKARKLLCNNCNNGLGRFEDNPLILIKAAKYLNEFRKNK